MDNVADGEALGSRIVELELGEAGGQHVDDKELGVLLVRYVTRIVVSALY